MREGGSPACLLDHVSGCCHTGAMRGQRAVYGPSSVDKALGSLPVVAELSRRLGLVGIIDRACPMRDDVPILTHGQVIEALVANRLTSPAPMVRVAGWAGSGRWPRRSGSRPRCSMMTGSGGRWTRSPRSWTRSWVRWAL